MDFMFSQGNWVNGVTYLLMVPVAGWSMIIFTTLIHEAGHALALYSQGLTGARITVSRGGDGHCGFADTTENIAKFNQPRVRMVTAISGCGANLAAGLVLVMVSRTWTMTTTEVPFGAGPYDMLKLFLWAFAFMNLFYSLGILIPRKSHDQDNYVMRAAWRDYRAGLRAKRQLG